MTGGSQRAERADLSAILRERGALDPEAVRTLFARLADAIGAWHDSGKAHGDLEPSRFMVWSSGREGAPFTVEVRPGAAGTSTPAWRAPELLDEGAPPAAPSADVWSLGLIAFALLTGRSYWRAASGPGHAGGAPQVAGHAGGHPQTAGHAGGHPQTPGHAGGHPQPPGHAGGHPQTPGHAGGHPQTAGHAGGNPQTAGHAGGNPQTPARAELLDEVRMGPLPPASERAADLGAGSVLPPSFDAWFSRCVTRTVAARFRTAREAGLAFETIMIPQQRESAPLFPLPRGRRFPISDAPAPRRVLLIDDDRMTLLILAHHLRQIDYEVLTASTGEEGLAMARRTQLALILLDFMLPDIDGPEVLRRLRAEEATADVPVILLTATELASDIAEGFRAGANDYLMKPVDKKLLAARVEAAIAAHTKVRRASVIAVRHQQLVADLEEARAEQDGTLSVLPASWSGWWAVGGVAPSGMVGGDLIAIFTGVQGARTAVVVDVAGHGAGAALVGASVRAALGLLLARFSLVDALAALNEELGAANSRHACLAAVQICGTDVTIINAGLPPVCVARRGEPILQVSCSGVPPGLLPDQTYQSTSFVAQPGDRIAVVSDGLVEPFGFFDDTLPILRDLGTFEPGRWTGREQPLDVEDQLRAELARLSRPQPDDATLLLLGALSPA